MAATSVPSLSRISTYAAVAVGSLSSPASQRCDRYTPACRASRSQSAMGTAWTLLTISVFMCASFRPAEQGT